eukprot:1191505-Prorocentrum_minimum.AAC.2
MFALTHVFNRSLYHFDLYHLGGDRTTNYHGDTLRRHVQDDDWLNQLAENPGGEAAKQVYSLLPVTIGSRSGYIFSSLSRLVPAPGIFSPPCHDWFPLRVLILLLHVTGPPVQALSPRHPDDDAAANDTATDGLCTSFDVELQPLQLVVSDAQVRALLIRNARRATAPKGVTGD